MKIYSTRHGQTSYNKQEIILGTTDIELDETGEEQALMLAEKIAGMNCIDIIIASPMKRAQRTACAVAARCGLDVITEERLREWDYGYYEGKSRFIDGFAENKTEFGVRMGKSGESLLQLSHRVYSALDDIIKNYSDKNVLIVSHGGVCRVIETYFNDMTTQQFSNWFMDNCGLIEYSIN
ncbi:MAG: histidine phosphatase family protein [Ruminococcus sp.]|nr:histidine phosphatase family protein [Ruminococcus sp.]MBP5578848.1 histidine phosphatase family protein [Ruminococcus sp.]